MGFILSQMIISNFHSPIYDILKRITLKLLMNTI